MRSARARPALPLLPGNEGEVDRAPIQVHGVHADPHTVAEADPPLRRASHQAVQPLLEDVLVIAERAHGDQPLHEERGELHEETELHDAGDEAVELLPDLVLHELRLLERDDLALGLHRDALPAGGVQPPFGEGLREPARTRLGERAGGQDFLQHAVDHEIGVSPDRRGEVAVEIEGETEVAGVLGAVPRLPHRAKHDLVDQVLLGPTLHGEEDLGEVPRPHLSRGARAGCAAPPRVDGQTEGFRQLRECGQVLRVRGLVHPVEHRGLLAGEELGHGLVGLEHELLDDPVRDVPLALHDVLGPPLDIEDDLRLGQVEVDASVVHPPPEEAPGERLHEPEIFDEGAVLADPGRVRLLENRRHGGVGHPGGAPDHALGEPRAHAAA